MVHYLRHSHCRRLRQLWTPHFRIRACGNHRALACRQGRREVARVCSLGHLGSRLLVESPEKNTVASPVSESSKQTPKQIAKTRTLLNYNPPPPQKKKKATTKQTTKEANLFTKRVPLPLSLFSRSFAPGPGLLPGLLEQRSRSLCLLSQKPYTWGGSWVVIRLL